MTTVEWENNNQEDRTGGKKEKDRKDSTCVISGKSIKDPTLRFHAQTNERNDKKSAKCKKLRGVGMVM